MPIHQRPRCGRSIQSLDAMRTLVAILIAALSGPATASSDGELAWTQVSFCNGAEYCVRIDTTPDNRLNTVAISHKGVDLAVPDLKSYDGEPNLRAVRLVSVEKPWGFINRLEIPFFGEYGSTLILTIDNDRVADEIQIVTAGQ